MGIDKATGQDRQARLYELTSQTSLPTMFHNEERPRNVWTEQLALVEQIGAPDSPKLIPDDFALRSEVYALLAIILAEDGLVWNMRIINDEATPSAESTATASGRQRCGNGKVGAVLKLLDERLAAQEARGSAYLVGDAVSAADIYWAIEVSMAVVSAPPSIMPVTKQNQGMLQFFAANGQVPAVAEAMSPRIEAHQHHVLTTYCETSCARSGDLL